MDPPNDHQCFSSHLLVGACKDGTTIGATPDYGNPDCVIAAENTVWYQTFINPGNNTLTISMENGSGEDSISGDIAFMLVEFANNDCYNLFNVIDNSTYCGPPDFSIDISGLNPNKTYYAQIITEAPDAGEFTICAEESSPPPGCAENDLCIKAFDISVGIDSFKCTTGCTVGATNGPTNIIGNCFYMANPTVWYSYIPTQRPGFVGIDLKSDSLTIIQLAIYAGDDCGNIQPIYCEYGLSGELYVELDTIQVNKTYYFAVSEATGIVGEFDICVDNYPLDVNCNIENELVVTNTSYGSNPNGPFQSGEQVEFCYRITDWNNENCNWLQGIVPLFGLGWDQSSYTTNGQPKEITKWPQAHVNGEWKWFGFGEVTYNIDNLDQGYSAGDPMPAGWYFVQNGIDDPDFSRGDGFSCSPDEDFNWEVCFKMTALSYPTCDALPDNGAGSVLMLTFSDSEIGAWDFEGCLDDFPKYFQANIECCPNPVVDTGTYTVCFGETLVIPLNSDPNNTVDYSWTIPLNHNVIGASAGTGDTIIQNLANLGNNTETITYIVSPRDTSGCLGPKTEIYVRVVPELIANAGPDKLTCVNNEVKIGGSPTGDGGGSLLLFYEWTPGGHTNPNPTVTPTGDVTYSVKVTDVEGCTDTDEVTINTKPQPHAQLSGSDVICRGDEGFVTLEFTGTPPFTFFLYEEGVLQDLEQTNSSTVQIPFSPIKNSLYQIASFHDSECEGYYDGFATIQVFENSFANISEQICFGEAYIINGNEYTEPGNYTETLEGQNSVGCDSIVNFNLAVFPEIFVTDVVIEDDTGSGNGSISFSVSGGTPPYTLSWNDTIAEPINLIAGTYTLTVTDEAGCEAVFEFVVPLNTGILNINQIDATLFPNPVKAGQSVCLALDDDHMLDQIKVYGVDGKLQEYNEFDIFEKENKFCINLDKPGLFILLYTLDNKHTIVSKIVVLE